MGSRFYKESFATILAKTCKKVNLTFETESEDSHSSWINKP